MLVRSGACRARSVQRARQARSKERQSSSPRAEMRATRASDADMAGSASHPPFPPGWRRAAICATARRYGEAATRRSAERTTEVASCAALASSGVRSAPNSCAAATALVSASRRGCGTTAAGGRLRLDLGLDLVSSHPFGVWPEPADLGVRIVSTAEHSIQARAALGQRGLHDDRGGILVRVGRSGEEPAGQHGRGRRDDVPQPFGGAHVVHHDRPRGGQPGADQADDARRGIKPGVEEPGHRQPGLVPEGGRAALAEIGGRAGGDQIAGEVEEPPQALHPARPHGQVPLPGQEPGQGILFLVGAGRDARGGARIGGAAGPVGPVRDGPRILGAQQDQQRAGLAHAGRKRDHSVGGNRHDDRRAPRRAGQVQGSGQPVGLRGVADRQLAGADLGPAGQRPGLRPGLELGAGARLGLGLGLE